MYRKIPIAMTATILLSGMGIVNANAQKDVDVFDMPNEFEQIEFNNTEDGNYTIDMTPPSDNTEGYTVLNEIATSPSLYINVAYGGSTDYLPLLTLSVKNQRTGTEETITTYADKYNVAKGAFELSIEGFTIQTNDKIDLKVIGIEDVVSSIFAYENGVSVPLTTETTTTLTLEYTEEASIKLLEGGKDAPVVIDTSTITNTLVYTVRDEDGNPIKHEDVTIEVGKDKKQFKARTDEQGKLVLSKDKIYPYFTIITNGKGVLNVDLPLNFHTGEDVGYLHEEDIVLEKSAEDRHNEAVAESEDGQSLYTVKMTTSVDTSLSEEWMTAIIELESGKLLEVDKYTTNLQLDKGDKIKKVTSKTAKIINYSVNGDVINIKLEPLYTFTLYNDGKDYDVTFLGKSGLSFKGKEKIVFGVMPNENIRVKDNLTASRHSIKITEEDKNYNFIVSKHSDGKGNKYNGKTVSNPHTNDIIYTLLVIGMVLLVAVGLLLVYKKRTKTINTGLILLLVGSQLLITAQPHQVNADANVGGADGGSNGGSSLSGTMLQMVEYIAGYEVYFVSHKATDENNKANDYIEKSGTLQSGRFDRSYRASAIYFAPDDLTFRSLTYDGSGVVSYEDNIGSHQSKNVVHNLQVISGENAIKNYLGTDIVKDNKSSTMDDLKRRSLLINTGSDNDFISTLSGIMTKAYSASAASKPISGRMHNNTPAGYLDSFGEAAAKQFNATISNLTDKTHTEKREKVIKGYLKLIKDKGLVSDYSAFEASMLKNLNDGNLVMQINTIVGITQYKSSGNKPHGEKPYAFMSVHDASTWFYYQMRMLRGEARVGTINTNHEKQMSQVGLPADTTLYWKWGRIGFTFRQYLSKSYTITAQPKGTQGKYPTLTMSQAIGSAKTQNPYGGWFLQPIAKTDIAGTPYIYVTAELNVNGTKVPIDLADWKREKKIKLSSLVNDKVRLKTSYLVGGKNYVVAKTSPVVMTAKDVPYENDTKLTHSALTPALTEESLLKKTNLSNKTTGTASVTASLDNNSLVMKPYFASYKFLSYYLGGIGDKEYNEGGTKVINKYYGVKSNNKVVYGDLHVHLVIDAKEEAPPADDIFVVPQWSLAEIEYEKYKDDQKTLKTVYDTSTLGIKPDKDNEPPMEYSSTTASSEKITAQIIGVKKLGGTKQEYTITPAQGIPLYLNHTEPLLDTKESWYQPIITYDRDKLSTTDLTIGPKDTETKITSLVYGKFTNPNGKRDIHSMNELNDMTYETPLNVHLRLIRSYTELDLTDYVAIHGNKLGKVTSGKVTGVDSRYKVEFVENGEKDFYLPYSYTGSDSVVDKDIITKTSNFTAKHSDGVSRIDLRDGYTHQTIVKQTFNYTNNYSWTENEPCEVAGIPTSCPKPRTGSLAKSKTDADTGGKVLPFTSLEVKWDFKVDFEKYVTDEQGGLKETYRDEEKNGKGNFSTWKLVDDERKFKFYPETVMYNELSMNLTDETIKYSVDFIIGEEERQLNTHFLTKVTLVPKNGTGDITLNTNINGSGATDSRAVTLANTLNVGTNTPVLPKGTSTINSLGLENAQIDMRFYLIDIEDNVVKTKMNPDSDSWKATEELVEEYLDSLKNDKGEITGKAKGYYYVGDKAYEPVLQDIGFRQEADPEVTEYKIEVRGGELTKVTTDDGTSHDASELRDKATGAYGDEELNRCTGSKVIKLDTRVELGCATTILKMYDDNTGLFSMLEKEAGKPIKAGWEDYITEGNILRNLEDGHDKALKLGKAWYYEDTTIFVVREYHYKFNIPTYMWTAKLPMDYNGIEIATPIDKNQYYTKGITSYIGTEYTFGKEDVINLTFDMNPKTIEDTDYGFLTHDKGHQFIIPNVSVLDALR